MPRCVSPRCKPERIQSGRLTPFFLAVALETSDENQRCSLAFDTKVTSNCTTHCAPNVRRDIPIRLAVPGCARHPSRRHPLLISQSSTHSSQRSSIKHIATTTKFLSSSEPSLFAPVVVVVSNPPRVQRKSHRLGNQDLHPGRAGNVSTEMFLFFSTYYIAETDQRLNSNCKRHPTDGTCPRVSVYCACCTRHQTWPTVQMARATPLSLLRC